MKSLRDDKIEIAEVLHALREQQQQLELVQQQQEQELQTFAEKAQGSDQHASVVQELRAEVTVLAGAVNMLSSSVEQLSLEDPQHAIQTEMGAIAAVVSKLSERIDRMDSMGLATPMRPAVEGSLPERRTPESVENAQALRQQLAVLVGDVQRLSTTSPSPSVAGGCSNAGSDRRDSVQDELMHSRISQKEHSALSSSMPLPVQTLSGKAPSPRKWLNEPLAVSVARSEGSATGSVVMNSRKAGSVVLGSGRHDTLQGSIRRTRSP